MLKVVLKNGSVVINFIICFFIIFFLNNVFVLLLFLGNINNNLTLYLFIGSNDNIGNCVSVDDIEIIKLVEGEINKYVFFGNFFDNYFDIIFFFIG